MQGSQEESSDKDMLQFQEIFFPFQTSGISGKAAIGTKNSMTGNKNRNFVMPHRSAYSLSGHVGQSFLQGQSAGNFAVGCSLPIGNGAEKLPYFFLEICS